MIRRKSCDVDVNRVGGICRLAKHLDLTKCLCHHSTFFFEGVRFTDKMDRNGHLDLFSASKAAEIGVDQTSSDRIDLPVLKDHIVDALARNIERKYRVHTGIGSQNSREILKLGARRERLGSTTVNNDRNLSTGAKPTIRVLSAFITLFSFNYNFLCHNFSLVSSSLSLVSGSRRLKFHTRN